MKRDTRKNDINPLATNRSETKIPTEVSGARKGLRKVRKERTYTEGHREEKAKSVAYYALEPPWRSSGYGWG